MADRILYADLETVSEDELKKIGASKYSKGESLVVTVCGFTFDNEPVRSVVNPGLDVLELPQEVVEHIETGGTISGWNAGNFEYNIFKNHFGLKIKPDQVKDTMQRALYAGLPGALGDCGPALRLNIVKDNTAHRLMLQMSRPRKHRGGKTSYWHIDEPEKLARLQAYCERDVEAEREIAKYIPELPAREQKIAALDRRANERGIKLDVRLIEKMIALADVATEEINQECAALTKGAVNSPGTQTAKLTAWLRERGLAIDSLAKGLVEDALSRVDADLVNSDLGRREKMRGLVRAARRRARIKSSREIYSAAKAAPFADVKRVLRLRQLAAKSSVKKLIAMQNCKEEHDNCVRGVLAYYGAARTGRWAGRLLQPQNMVRPTFKTVKEAINMILLDGSKDAIESVFPPMLEVIASCLRGCLIPREGYRFVTPDLSQIEARMVAWLAGQDDILEVFARGDDVYTHTARKIGSDNRQLGKVLVLACIGEDTPVLTDKGLVKIQDVTKDHRVWDGLQWVTHKGLVEKGQKETLPFFGARLTPDHAVLCGETWFPAGSVARSGRLLLRALGTASASWPLPASLSGSAEACAPSQFDARVEPQSTLSTKQISERAQLLVATLVHELRNWIRERNTSVTRIFARTKSIVVGYSTELPLAYNAATTQKTTSSKTTADAGLLSTSPGAPRTAWVNARRGEKNSSVTFSRLKVGITPLWNLIARTSTKVMFREICASLQKRLTRSTSEKWPSFKAAFSSSKKRTLCYDLAFAGPLNRFAIWTEKGPLIVHNCGYGMGPEKFADTAETYGLDLSPQYAEELVMKWREANASIVNFWWESDRVVRQTIRQAQQSPLGRAENAINPYVTVTVNKARNGSLLMTLILPSGRRLFYRDINLEIEDKDAERAAARRDFALGEIDAAEFADIMTEIDLRRVRESITYSGVHQTTKKWTKIRTYGGKIVENCTQAAARDVICDMALAIDKEKLGELVLSVHDELIFEVPEDEAEARYARIEEIMSTAPEWAPGLPVKSEGNVVERYGK